MREILFRGKRIDTREWVEGFYLTSTEFDNDGLAVITTDNPRQAHYVHKETVGQFTGLYDKYGKRIWENDIVKTKFGRLCKMVWRQTQCFVGWDFEVCDFDFGVNDFSKPPSGWDLYFPENLEVIGNSIDNTELLTAERIGENEN